MDVVKLHDLQDVAYEILDVVKLQDLQDVANEILDVLDDWEHNQAIRKSEERNANDDADSSAVWGKKVRSFFKYFFACFKDVRKQGTILEIRELTAKLNWILEKNRKHEFDVIEGTNLGSSEGRRSSYLGDGGIIFGRDDDRNVIVDKLLKNGEEDDDTRIVCIVGGAGLGKTTVAQLVYTDNKVVKHFELRVWVWVSGDMKMIARKILEAAGENISPDEDRLHVLLHHVRYSLSGKKFLVVLDDAWSENFARWGTLQKWLQGLRGSRVLLTTRNDDIAVHMGSYRSDIHILNPLSTDDCWSIISYRALRTLPPTSQELESIGRSIALKCEGFPLLAKSLGDMLATKKDVQRWKAVLNNSLWETVGKDVSDILYLSYRDLSSMLKKCFASCAIFEKGEKIYREELLRIWLTHDSVSLRGKGNVETVHTQGIDHFEDLAMRSFFRDMRKSGYKENECYVTMYYFMHEFLASLSKRWHCYVMDGNVEEGHHSTDDTIGKARSFRARRVSQSQITSLIRRLKCVRVLVLKDSGELSELPQEIGELSHLRYLQLVNLSITALPDTLCELYHLQTLDLAACLLLTSLPQHINKLINLRHLLVNSEHMFHEGLAKLTGLWTLNCFVAGKNWARLTFLKKLNQLRGAIQIYLNEMGDDGVADAAEARLIDKIYVKEFEIILNGEVTSDALNALNAPPNVDRLRLGRYMSNQFPEWITSLNSLREFELLNCFSNVLPRLGKLPNLEYITLCDMVNLECLGIDFLGIGVFFCDSSFPATEIVFPKLKKMRFQDCKKWRRWEDVGKEVRDQNMSIMPYLEEIEFINCPNLQILPHNLLGVASSLKSLTINQSKNLVEYYIQGDGRDMIYHVPNIMVDVQNWKPGISQTIESFMIFHQQ